MQAKFLPPKWRINKMHFWFWTLVHFSFFFKLQEFPICEILIGYAATFHLPNSISSAPLWLIVKVQWTFKEIPCKNIWRPLVEKCQGNPQFFCSNSVELPTSVKLHWRNGKIPHRFWENRKKIYYWPNFQISRISHLRNFDTTSMPVRTVDGESLSEIAIHNFKKSLKKLKFAFSPMVEKMVYTLPRST